MVYHTSPTSEASSPSLFNMTGDGHKLQMELDFARADLHYDFGSPSSWAATGTNPMSPMPVPQEYVTARQYLLQHDLSLMDPCHLMARSLCTERMCEYFGPFLRILY